MKFLSSVMKLVRRKRPLQKATPLDDPISKPRHSEEQYIGAGKFRCPVLWKSSDGKWHRHQLSVRRCSDSSFWFSLTRMGTEQALHNSSQLMKVSHDQRKGVLHLIFVSGVLSLRFPSNLQTQQYLAWAAASAIKSTGNVLAGKLFRGSEQKSSSRAVHIITKDASLVIMDVKRQCPLLFTTAQLIRAVSVSGSAVALLSMIPGNDHFLNCDGGKDLRSWYEQNTVKKQRQKIPRRVSKPRSRVGRPRMGVLATRRNRISEASFERIVRRRS